MTKVETLVNEALDAMEVARGKLSDALSAVGDNDYGNSGASFVKYLEGTVASKLIAAYSSVEDLYSYAEDLVEAP